MNSRRESRVSMALEGKSFRWEFEDEIAE